MTSKLNCTDEIKERQKNSPKPIPKQTKLVVLDSGATDNIIASKDADLLGSQEPIKDPHSLACVTANSTTMYPTATGTLSIGNTDSPGTDPVKTAGTLYPDAGESLMSLAEIIDENPGAEATFNAETVKVVQNGKTIAVGQRTRLPGCSRAIWSIPVMIVVAALSTIATTAQACYTNYAFATRQYQHRVHLQSAQAKMEFLSAVLGNPVQQTLLKNLDLISSITSHLGITADQARKNAAHSVHSAAGHLKRARQNFRSSKPTTPPKPKTEEQPPAKTEGGDQPPPKTEGVDEPHPEQEDTDDEDAEDEWKDGIHVHNITRAELSKQELTKMYGDFTGNLQVPSFDNETAIMIFYHAKARYIKAIPIVADTSPSLAYQQAYEFFSDRGLHGDWFCSDNATSKATKDWFAYHNVTVQLVPPHNHRANVAERMIQVFKDHFVSCLSGVDISFPMKHWNKLLEHAEIALNLLRRSAIDPSKSAWEVVYRRAYDINAHPLMPPGILAMVHESVDTRPSFGARAQRAWYVGPAPQHYRCYKFITETGSRAIISDTAEWFPIDVVLPGATATEQLNEALRDVTTALNRLKTDDNRIITVRPKAVAVLEEMQRAFDGKRHKCANCGKVYQDAIYDDWTACRKCDEWFCWVCSGHTAPGPGVVTEYARERDYLAKHEMDAHGLDPEPKDQPPAEPEGGKIPAPIAKPQAPKKPSKTAPTTKTTPAAAIAETSSAKFWLQSDEALAPWQLVQGKKGKKGSKSNPIVYDDVKYKRKRGDPKLPRAQKSRPPPGRDPATREKRPATKPQKSQMPENIENKEPVAPTGIKPATRSKSNHRQASLALSTELEAEKIASEIELAQQKLWACVDQNIGPDIAEGRERQYALGAKALGPTGKQLSFKQATSPNHPEREKWLEAADKEIDMVVEKQGAMKFIDHLPEGRSAVYYRAVLEYDKFGKERIRGTLGGDRSDLEFTPASISSRNVSMINKKIFLNKALSEGKELATGDLKNFYVTKMNTLHTKQYARINHSQMAPATITKHNQQKHAKRGFSLTEVSLSIYGLPESGRNAQNHLVHSLSKLGYMEEERTEKLMIFRHTDPANDSTFIVNTDDFAFAYDAKDKHIIQKLEDDINAEGYTLKINWEPTHYCGMRIEYAKNDFVHLDLPGYTEDLLEKTGMNNVLVKTTPMPAPAKIMGPQSMFVPEDKSNPMSTEQVETSQAFLGGALYAAITCRADIMYAVAQLISELHETPTLTTYGRVEHLAGYLKHEPNLGVTYYPSSMKLIAYTDSNLKHPNSKTGGFFFLGREDDPEWVNGPIFTQSKLQPITAAAASEAEYIGCFMNGKSALSIRQGLDAFGYPQKTTPFKGDNAASIGAANDTCVTKNSRYVDAKFHWFRDRVRRQDFSITWIRSEDNIADAFTKALTAIIFRRLLQYLATRSPSTVSSKDKNGPEADNNVD